MVDARFGKSNLLKSARHLLVPSSPGLLQTIQALQESTYHPLLTWFKVSLGWMHVNNLVQRCIEVSTFDIHLVDLPIVLSSICQHDPNSRHLHSQREGLV